ncbi:MAG: hypothetical protein GY862_27950 [Gammaproteobacteria bacterium]|nr:hypothetical protein [Gammaproteobacteria bacterium]
MAINTLNDKKITQDRYRERVNDFFQRMRSWLPDSLETAELPEHAVHDATGEYTVEMLGIYKKDIPESDDLAIKISPRGASTLIGEGMLEVSGPIGYEPLIYLRKNALPKAAYIPGIKRPLYRGVERDDWYWLESKSVTPVNFGEELCIHFVKEVEYWKPQEMLDVLKRLPDADACQLGDAIPQSRVWSLWRVTLPERLPLNLMAVMLLRGNAYLTLSLAQA